jgi:type I restriction enzyme S subunit
MPIQKTNPAEQSDQEFVYLDIASIDNSRQRITAPKTYSGRDAPSRARQLVRENDILFSTVRTYLRNIAQVPAAYDGQVASTGFAVLRANKSVLHKYLFYFTLTQEFLEPLNELQRGTSYPAVREGDVRAQRIPIPPIHEQARIVSRIEEHLSELDAGVVALERVRAGLKRYKASVLEAAVSGRLLHRKGGLAPGELPPGWEWVQLADVAEQRLGKMLDQGKNTGELRPYLRNVNVRWFGINLTDTQKMRVQESELEAVSVREGDLVVCEGGEPGRAAVWNGSEPMLIQKALHRVRCTPRVLPEYLAYSLASDASAGRLEKYFTGSTIKHFTGQSLRRYAFRLPPIDEQRRIQDEIGRRLSSAEQVEVVAKAGLVRAARLRQAVLKAAFEGRM